MYSASRCRSAVPRCRVLSWTREPVLGVLEMRNSRSIGCRGHGKQCSHALPDTGAPVRTPVLPCEPVLPCVDGPRRGEGGAQRRGASKSLLGSFARSCAGWGGGGARRGGPSPVAECRSRARPDPHRELATGTPLGEDMCRPQARHQVRICGEGRMKETGVGAGG